MRLTILLATLFSFMSTFGQEESYIDKGLIQAYGNIGFGSFNNSSNTNVYINSGLNYYVSNNVSIRSSLNYFVTSSGSSEDLFDQNHSQLVGCGIHLKTKNQLDPYLSIMPGLALSRVKRNANLLDDYPSLAFSENKSSINPLFAVGIGANYFANKIFNIYFHLQYASGKHFSDAEAISLNELKFSVGLGWHLWARNNRLSFKKPQ
ncbi:MAG: porin family protein [Flavobacteriales bacterium]|nr:porin family protein [Flavobacteriales bacterium]